MKLIIAGSRDMEFSELILNDISRSIFPGLIDEATEIVSGMASGIDQVGVDYSKIHDIKLKRCYANWDKHGRAAGPIRNKEMAEYADALLLIWDGQSKGSSNMKKEMEKLNKPIYEIIIKGPKE
jgi:hypothetical protein